jgi:outer membrane immunogenic protein
MKTTKTLAAATLATMAALGAALGTTIGAAKAADLPMPAPAPAYAPPPPPPVYNWTGCYVGGGGGHGMWNQYSYVTTSAVPTGITAPTTNGGEGWFGQGQAGCDYQFTAPIFDAGVVIGLFGDYEGGSISGSSDFPGAVGTEKETSSWAAGARAGLLVTPRFLTYFDGGYTQAHFDQVNYNIALPGGAFSGLSLAAHTYNGWFLGSGFEYSFDWLPVPGLFFKTEYRYSQYGGSNGDSIPLTGSTLGLSGVTAALQSQKSTQMVSSELVWRFNWLGH